MKIARNSREPGWGPNQLSFPDTLFNMGIVEQLVALISGQHEPFHEHALSVLACLVDDNPKIVQECRRPELGLETSLREKKSALTNEDKDKYEVKLFI